MPCCIQSASWYHGRVQMRYHRGTLCFFTRATEQVADSSGDVRAVPAEPEIHKELHMNSTPVGDSHRGCLDMIAVGVDVLPCVLGVAAALGVDTVSFAGSKEDEDNQNASIGSQLQCNILYCQKYEFIKYLALNWTTEYFCS